ncbi:MAG TPA: ADP-ribosylglycohydrolase family protein [Rhodothermales bacterium]|nr:ADP-ribosylglycohydrolase family protein [Rhodothermales bacterium]
MGTLLGGAVGDALGMPVEGLSHQNVRTFYKGIKAYRADERRSDLAAGQWTDDTQLTFAIVQGMVEAGGIESLPAVMARRYVDLLPDARRWGGTTRTAVERLAGGTLWEHSGDDREPTNGAAMRAAPLGSWWAASEASRDQAWSRLAPVLRITHRHPVAVVAGFGQAFAVRLVIASAFDSFDPVAFWSELMSLVQWAERRAGEGSGALSGRLAALQGHLDDFPLDLQDRCNGAGVFADESWPFAVAMFARNPMLIEATLLSTINVGGDADTTGSMTGALLGALHGWSAFPPEWREGLQDVDRLEANARAFADLMLH